MASLVFIAGFVFQSNNSRYRKLGNNVKFDYYYWSAKWTGESCWTWQQLLVTQVPSESCRTWQQLLVIQVPGESCRTWQQLLVTQVPGESCRTWQQLLVTQVLRWLPGVYHRQYNKQMRQLLYEPLCQLFCSTPSGSETQLQICYKIMCIYWSL